MIALKCTTCNYMYSSVPSPLVTDIGQFLPLQVALHVAQEELQRLILEFLGPVGTVGRHEAVG